MTERDLSDSERAHLREFFRWFAPRPNWKRCPEGECAICAEWMAYVDEGCPNAIDARGKAIPPLVPR